MVGQSRFAWFARIDEPFSSVPLALPAFSVLRLLSPRMASNELFPGGFVDAPRLVVLPLPPVCVCGKPSSVVLVMFVVLVCDDCGVGLR